MTVQELIEALKKLPPAALLQDVAVQGPYGGRGRDVIGASFEGNFTKLETK
jgi:hypothetical protein